MEYEIKEKILENYPTFVTIEKTKKILEQIQNCVCKIKNMKGKGTGFFCKIPIEKGKIFVLMTNNHLIDEEIIKKEKNIYVTLNDDKEKVNIILDDNRKIYSSEKYDTTIIEVKPEKDKIKYFLELDEDIFQGNLSKESIYILQYPKNLDEQRAAISYGILAHIYNYDLIHYCCTEKGSSGSPILKLSNNKVIGIHKEEGKFNFNFNKGSFLKEPINEYINNINIINNKNTKKFDNELNKEKNKMKKNEIKMKLKIEKEDIKKKIYFLSNVIFFGNENKTNKILDKLNESNTDLFIDEKKYKFQKYLIFKKEGIFSIKIKIKICIEDCQSMFFNCRNIIDIDLSSFDTKNVTNMNCMFRECENLENINLSNFDTRNVTDMKFMFGECKNLKNIDLSSFDTKNVTNMKGMFSGCEHLINLDLSHFNTKKVLEIQKILTYCYNLRKVKVNKESFKKIQEAVTDSFIKIFAV